MYYICLHVNIYITNSCKYVNSVKHCITFYHLQLKKYLLHALQFAT